MKRDEHLRVVTAERPVTCSMCGDTIDVGEVHEELDVPAPTKSVPGNRDKVNAHKGACMDELLRYRNRRRECELEVGEARAGACEDAKAEAEEIPPDQATPQEDF